MNIDSCHPQSYTIPKVSMEISLGGNGGLRLGMDVKKTPINRFRYWMLCKFFPFKIERWE